MIPNNYNPDILNCLANLSNDEVFTPPVTVNKMLDILPKEIWKNKDIKFLDPCSKTGVFLREITLRLLEGLKKEIPNLEKRLKHILNNQVFGIGITELTALMSRRTLYCSKFANGKYSINNDFDNKDGNILFTPSEHKWINDKCMYCGANKKSYYRDNTYETYSYNFIHEKIPIKFKKMKFDVIIGNPPYQLNDGGGVGSSAIPIYDKFVIQAKKLNPSYLTMIIPSRWFTGGRGLDSFRDEMLNDKRIKEIHDFKDAKDCFPGNPPKGGVCYFLWDKNYDGECEIFSHEKGKITSSSKRPLLDEKSKIFIRDNNAIKILDKIRKFNEKSFSDLISSNDPFGFDVREEKSYKRVKPKFKLKKFKDSTQFYYLGWKNEGLGYIEKKKIKKNIEWIDMYKIFIPKAWGIGDYKNDWLKPIIADNNSCCTETYLVVGPFKDKKYIQNIYNYMQTKFFHYMVSIIKITQNTMQKAYTFVPIQDFSKDLKDKDLYKKYNLTDKEINIIEEIKVAK